MTHDLSWTTRNSSLAIRGLRPTKSQILSDELQVVSDKLTSRDLESCFWLADLTHGSQI